MSSALNLLSIEPTPSSSSSSSRQRNHRPTRSAAHCSPRSRRCSILWPALAWLLVISLLVEGKGHRSSRHLRRRPIGHGYRRDEVNFSLSQEYGHQSDEDGENELGGGAGTSNGGKGSDGAGADARLPEFVGVVPNVTVQIGREARLPCIIQHLGSYRAAWIRDEVKNILTLQRQMVTRDPRIRLQEESTMETEAEGGNRIRHFVLIIRDVQVSDRGGYMCQVNTVPMRAQIGYLRVVVPPEIIDEESSNDITVVEGANVTLKCRARGYPQPEIEWRKEDGTRVPLGHRANKDNNKRQHISNKTEGEVLSMTRVTRVHSGAWLCIAFNGVMPSVSRRILLNVQFAPQIWIPVEEIGAPLGSNISLDCHIEAYPLPLNFWSFGSNTIYISGRKYEVSVKEKNYKRHLRLTIYNLAESDLGVYRCHAQNSLAEQQKEVLIFASERRQQTKAKPTELSPEGGGGEKRRRRRRKKKKPAEGSAVNRTEEGDDDDEGEEYEGNYEEEGWWAPWDTSSGGHGQQHGTLASTLLIMSLVVCWLCAM